jgi:hypothetical protein
VSNAPYARPREPFSTNGVPYWYERHQDDGGSGASGFQDWVPPSQAPGYTYRPGRTKVTQLNTTTAAVVNSFGGNGVRLFNFFSHFDPGGEYSDYICPPPNDGVPPNLFLQCPGGQSALLARDPDGSHLTLPPGGHDILEYYLRPCVRGLLGIAGGNVNACS